MIFIDKAVLEAKNSEKNPIFMFRMKNMNRFAAFMHHPSA